MAALLIAAVAAVYFACFVGYGVNLEDEGLILFQIARTARGELPYVDFHTGYTPGTFYLNAWLLRAGGDSVALIRAVLVLVNAATVGLIYLLAQPLAGRALAATAALGYAAFLPCFVGEFASFNIPYPSWYAGLLFLGVQITLDRYLVRGGGMRLALAGVLVGLTFTFKPNAGVLAALAAGIVLAVLHAGRDDADGRGARALLLAALVVVLMAFGFRIMLPELWLIAGPVMFLLVGRVWWARGTVGEPVGLWPSIGALTLGGLVVTLPWMAWAVHLLGLGGFVREVLLLGSDADIIYATPYPIPLGFPASWPALAAFGLLLFGLLGVAVERGRVRADVALGVLGVSGLAFVIFLLRWARIPEGLTRSITWQVQHVGFYAVPFMGIAVAVVFLRRLRAARIDLRERDRRLLAALVFSLCMYVELYPRVDTMHLIIAMPAALVLAAAVAARLADAWARILSLRPSVLRAGLVLGGAILSLVAALPNFAGFVSASTGQGGAQGFVRLDSPRIPVRIEAVRGADLRALNGVLQFLRPRLHDDEFIFAFPALALVPFALGHPTPTPHDYYFAGRPDHLAEAEIVRTLRRVRPRFVVTLNRRLGFFSESPAYYFILREHVREHYHLAGRFGRYDVLRRRDLEDAPVLMMTYAPPALADGDLTTRLSDPDREQRRAAILEWLAAHAGLPVETVVPPDGRKGLLLMRNLAEIADPRGLPIAHAVFSQATWRLRNEAKGALNFLALRDNLGRHIFTADVAEAARVPPPGLDALDTAVLQETLEVRKRRLETGTFAAWALRTRRTATAAGSFETMLREEPKRPYFRVEAAKGLVALGHDQHVCTLVGLLGIRKHEVQNTVPSFLIEEAVTNPEVVAGCLQEGLGAERALEREMSAWIAGAARLSIMAPALRTALDDGDESVRLAAIWALGRVQDEAARPQLVALLDDEDPRLRAFASEALAHLGERNG